MRKRKIEPKPQEEKKLMKKRLQPPSKRNRLRTFDVFQPDDIPVDKSDAALDQISQKISILTLQVSRVECRLADLETRVEKPLIQPFGPLEYPDFPNVLPGSKKLPASHPFFK